VFGTYLTKLSAPAAALLIVSAGAFAQGAGGFDYYAPRTDNADITRLKNVEGYHLAPGQSKMARREYYYAQQEFEFILHYYPNHPKGLSLLSDLCEKYGDKRCDAAAEAWFDKAIKLNPEVGQTYLLYGIHLHRKRQLEQAVKAYRRAIELAPSSVNAHYNLGLAYVDLKQYDLANQHAQRSYQLGAYTPGLKNKLEKVGKWNPNVALAPTADATPAAASKSEPPKPAN
jgi:tetratricopeptide (TPR) repeat protein